MDQEPISHPESQPAPPRVHPLPAEGFPAEVPLPEVRPISYDPAAVRAANGEGPAVTDSPAPQPAGLSARPSVPDRVEASAAVLEAEEAAALRNPEAGPNWMLAFVCAWSGAASINEAVALAAPGARLFFDLGFMGYLLLGLGLLAFAVESLRWGRRRSGGTALLLAAATVMTLVGVVCLVLWPAPGRKI